MSVYTFQRLAQPDGTELGRLHADGTPLFDVIQDIDTEMFCILASPMWIAALSSGAATVDAANKRVTFPDYGGVQRVFTARTEDQRDEVTSLLAQFAGEIESSVGLTTARSRALVRILWRFLKAALPLLRR